MSLPRPGGCLCRSSSDEEGNRHMGTVVGYIKAFDKHMNMVLSDCMETKHVIVGIEWSPRPEDIEAAKLNASSNGTDEHKALQLTSKGARRLIKKYLYQQKVTHFHQTMLRGDNIVLVCVARNMKK